MKRIFVLLSLLLSAALAVMCIVYHQNGGTLLKGVCSGLFTTVGAVNLVYCVLKKKKLLFPVLAFSGLLLCTVGDIVLLQNFILGAALFVCGHVLYVIAYCILRKPSAFDIPFVLIITAASVCVVTLVPVFNYGSTVMEAVAVVYAVVISFMLGKAISNVTKLPSSTTVTAAVGSLLFFVSDIALAFNVFGGTPTWADPLCLVTYFPGQLLIAWSIFAYASTEQ